MKRDFYLVTTCVNAKGQDIDDMVHHDRCMEITRKAFLRHVDYKTVLAPVEESMGYSIVADGGLRMASDCMVSYWRSWYQGLRCYYIAWSGIEYVFLSSLDKRVADYIKTHKCRICGKRLLLPDLRGRSYPKNDEDEIHYGFTCGFCGADQNHVEYPD